jgi:chorismate mutase
MENQQIKNFNEKLAKYRTQIDEIDNQIIQLLKSRMKIVDSVGDLKKQQKEKFFIKSAREADMIKNIIAKAEEINFKFPVSAFINIWRKIISSANISEQKLKIIFFNQEKSLEKSAYYKSLIKEYYLEEIEIIESSSIKFCFDEALKIDENCSISIFPIDQNCCDKILWWQKLGNVKGFNGNLKIFMKLPFYKNSDKDYDKNSKISKPKNSKQPILFLLANKESEQSQQDNSLIYIESSNKLNEKNLDLVKDGKKITLKIIDQNQNSENKFCFLIEIEGFFNDEDLAKLKIRNKFIKKIKLLGNYPKEIEF